LSVNRVVYCVRVTVYPWADGSWRVGPEEDPAWWGYLRATRKNATSFRDGPVTHSAREKLRAEIERVVGEWAPRNALAFAQAAVATAEAQAEAKRHVLKAARASVVEAEAELREAEAELKKARAASSATGSDV
jgi:hypothetical protein